MALLLEATTQIRQTNHIFTAQTITDGKRKERINNLEETPHSHLPYSDFGDSMISDKQQMKKKVFVSGCYDLLHSGHVEFSSRHHSMVTCMWV